MLLRYLSSDRKDGNKTPAVSTGTRGGGVRILPVVEHRMRPRIVGIEFGLISPDEIRRSSVVEVTTPVLYERNLPRPKGLNDHRMGTVDRRIVCGTCGHGVDGCNGHPGHIELAAPVYHVGYIDTVLKVLRGVCYFCSRLLAKEDDPRLLAAVRADEGGKVRLSSVTGALKGRKKCAHCLGAQPKYVRNALGVKADWSAEAVASMEDPEERALCGRPFTAAEARSVLKYVPDDDCRLMGLCPERARPEWMILTALTVPPPIARPSIMASEGSKAKGQDDLTHKLQNILKHNATARAALDRAAAKAADPKATSQAIAQAQMSATAAISDLQYEVATYMNNDIRGQKQSLQRSGAPIRSLVHRIRDKEGRVRGNLMGKRVDYSSRSVISPDPILDIDEIGVPEEVALVQTLSVRVTFKNIEELTRRVRIGPGRLGGAARVITPEGKVIQLAFREDRERLRIGYGYVVERYLCDGDYVVFNRQPSLHKMSMMGHRARIMPCSTFRLNLAVVGPYNADFDGDEMNMHVPQNIGAQVEARELMAVPKQILSSQSNKPCMGLVQDSLLACYLLTRRDVFLDRAEMMNLAMQIRYEPAGRATAGWVLPRPAVLARKAPGEPLRPLWTGKQVMSMLLPRGLSLRKCVRGAERVDAFDPDGREETVLIVDGDLLAGTLCKQTMGASSGGIVHLLCRDYGSEAAARFMSDCQRAVNAWLVERGFSVGIGDCVIPATAERRVAEIVDAAETRMAALLAEAVDKEGFDPRQLEDPISQILSRVLNKCGKVVQESLPATNALNALVTGGSKGSTINASQVTANVGQQSVEGGRIFAGGARDTGPRTLPRFGTNDRSAAAHGFVRNSYIAGLTATEFFFHAMGGREGLVDTAVKTASTGYIQRKLQKAMESLRIAYDGTVRNAMEEIVQACYGGDGYDASALERCSLVIVGLDDQALLRRFAHVPPPDAASVDPDWRRSLRTEVSALEDARDEVRSIRGEVFPWGTLDEVVYVPVHAPRLLESARLRDRTPGPPVTVTEVVERVDALCCSGTRHRPGALGPLFCALLRATFCSRAIVSDARLTRKGFDWLMEQASLRIEAAVVHPGEMVGSLAAESIGEPCTQMTLNTFHYAGVSSKNVTLGVPRIKELFEATRNLKTPSMTVCLRPEFQKQPSLVHKVRRSMEATYLHRLVMTSEVVHDPDPMRTRIDDDVEMMEMHACFCPRGQEALDGPSEWIVRLVLNKNAMLDRDLTPSHVEAALRRFAGDSAEVVASEANMPGWVARVRPLRVEGMTKKAATSDEHRWEIQRTVCYNVLNSLLTEVFIGGLSPIDGTAAREMPITTGEATGGGLRRTKEWVIDTSGSSLLDAWALECVDWTRTVSNDVCETLEVLGIEAAIAVLFGEIKQVLSFDGTYLNDRHVATLVETMTHRGYLMPISRHGINRINTGPLVQASFEETADVLLNAGAFGETDGVRGVTENIMLGQLIPAGTGVFEVLPKEVDPVPEADAGTVVSTAITEPLGGAAGIADGRSEDPFADWTGDVRYDNSAAIFVPYSPPLDRPYEPASPPPGLVAGPRPLEGVCSDVTATAGNVPVVARDCAPCERSAVQGAFGAWTPLPFREGTWDASSPSASPVSDASISRQEPLARPAREQAGTGNPRPTTKRYRPSSPRFGVAPACRPVESRPPSKRYRPSSPDVQRRSLPSRHWCDFAEHREALETLSAAQDPGFTPLRCETAWRDRWPSRDVRHDLAGLRSDERPPRTPSSTPPETPPSTPPEGAHSIAPEASQSTPPEGTQSTPPEGTQSTPPEATGPSLFATDGSIDMDALRGILNSIQLPTQEGA